MVERGESNLGLVHQARARDNKVVPALMYFATHNLMLYNKILERNELPAISPVLLGVPSGSDRKQ